MTQQSGFTEGPLLEPENENCVRVGGVKSWCDLQDLLSLLRPNLQRFTTLEEACSATAALEAQEEGGLEAIEEVPSDEEDGESGSEMGHDGRGRLCDVNSLPGTERTIFVANKAFQQEDSYSAKDICSAQNFLCKCGGLKSTLDILCTAIFGCAGNFTWTLG